MGVTLREAMKIGGLVHCKVVAGENGLDRTIDAITVMEVPDVIRWLKGNILLLTSLYPIKEDKEAISQLVRRLDAAGSSALAIKTEQFVSEIPEIILQEGNRLQFPIIEIHKEVSYLDIMTPLMELILKKLDTGKEQLELLVQWMTELAMSGKGVPALIEALEQMTDNTVTVGAEIPALALNKGMDFPPLTYAQKYELKAAKRPIRMNRQLNKQLTPCIVTPIMLNDELVGDLTCWGTHSEFIERDFQLFERTMVLVALEFLKIITKADVEQSYMDSFVSDLLLGQVQDAEEAIGKGKRYGWDLTLSFQVLCISVKDLQAGSERAMAAAEMTPELKRRLMLQASALFRTRGLTAIVTLLKGAVIVLLPQHRGVRLPPDDAYKRSVTDLAHSVRQHLAEEAGGYSFDVGIGRLYPGLSGIHQGYREASSAVTLGKPILQQGCVHYEDLGIFRILSQYPDRKELESLYGETVLKLAEYDSIHQASLVLTLEAYFASNGSLSETAEKLYIHVNTMKYRLHKIEQLTDCRVNDAEQRLLLHIGLKIYQIMKSESVS